VRRAFGVLFQSNALWSSKTVGENIELPLQQHSQLTQSERRDIVALKLARVGLAGCQERWPAELSGGMAKRAAFARALALDPRIVFLDEPTAGLDPVHARELDDLIVETRDTFGTTMVIVTHDTKRIAALADRMVFLHADSTGVIAEGSPKELMQAHGDERVRKFFAADIRDAGDAS
jgi:phospholipid/cholesterol/gamma-HCH transport system ATP-binding protein